jgi:hypothetical protein
MLCITRAGRTQGVVPVRKGLIPMLNFFSVQRRETVTKLSTIATAQAAMQLVGSGEAASLPVFLSAFVCIWKDRSLVQSITHCTVFNMCILLFLLLPR